MKKVLILDAGQRSALAVTRSLGKHNIPICTAEDTPASLAGASKYSQQHFTYPSPGKNPDQFIEYLSELVRQQQIEILLPMTELTTMLLLQHADAFPDTKIPFSGLDVVDSLADKCLLMKAAETMGIPIPRTWYVDDPKDLPCDLAQLPYPIVLKPGKSWLFYNGQWSRAAVLFAKDAAEAKHLIDSYWAFQTHPFMLQECVEGYGAGVFAIYDQGKPLAFFAHQRLREKPPSGGVSVLSESKEVEAEPEKHTQTLLNNVNWHGVAMVEFKIAPDGTPYLMEINTRFWGSLQLAIDSGVDFPHLLYQVTCGEKPEAINSYRTGLRLRWLLGDLDNLYLTLKDKQTGFTAKLKAVAGFFTPSLKPTRHEVNRFDDLNPFWFELKQYLRDITGIKNKD